MPKVARSARHAPPDLLRLAAVVALLAVASIGLRSRAALSSVSHPAAAAAAGRPLVVVFGALDGIGALACIGLLILVFRMSSRKRKRDDQLYFEHDLMIPWWSRALALLVVLAVVAVPLVLLGLAFRGHPHGLAFSPAAPAGPARRPVTSPRHATSGGTSWWLAGGLAAAGLAAAGLALGARRRPLSAAARNQAAPLTERLAAATSAATAALSSHADPRKAIIACYAAMERSLARAGSPPAAADTPAEVLGRASAAGLVRSAAAEALTGLFRRARYSQHALAEEDRTAATNALAGIHADLREQARPVADFGNDR